MDNLDFLKQILMSNTHYWIVAQQNYASINGRYERTEDSIWFISIDYNIQLNKKYEEITLSDIEKLNRSDVQNISLSEDYPPFQIGISMRRIYKGWPIPEEKSIKQVMVEAVNLKSKDFWDYKSLTEIPTETPITN